MGRRELVERLRRDPLKRAVRCDKLAIAALEATLRLYRYDAHPGECIPTLRHLARPLGELRRLAEAAARLLAEHLGDGHDVCVEESSARIGSGAQPDLAIPSFAVSIACAGGSAEALAARFRTSDPPVLGRIANDRLLLDVRTVAGPDELLPRPASGGGAP